MTSFFEAEEDIDTYVYAQSWLAELLAIGLFVLWNSQVGAGWT